MSDASYQIQVENHRDFVKPYKLINLEQGSQEWHKFRADKYGASAAPIIMGESPWQTPLGLYEGIVYGAKKEGTEAMKRGASYEPAARDWMNADRTPRRRYVPAVLQSVDKPHIIASLDGFYEDEEGNPCLLEIKCPGRVAHDSALDGEIPEYYRAQLQQQMFVAGAYSDIYFSFDPDREERDRGVILVCERDDAYIAKLVDAIDAFHERVVNLIPPEPSDKDFVEIFDGEKLFAVAEYERISREIAAQEKILKGCKEAIVNGLPHRRVKIGGVKVQKVSRKGSIDYAKILSDYKIFNSESYRKENSEYWTIS